MTQFDPDTQGWNEHARLTVDDDRQGKEMAVGILREPC